MNAQLKALPLPRSFFIVMRPGETSFTTYTSREHAEAVCTVNRHAYPNIGPWEVIPLAEVL